MKQTLCIMLLFLLFGITKLQAQNEKQAQPTSDEVLKARLHAGLARANQKTPRVAVNTTNVQVQSKYNYRDGEILDRLNMDAIPADFPKYDGASTNQQYTEQMEKWYKANPALIRKESNTNEQK